MDIQILTLFQKYVNEQCNQQELEEVFSILKNGQYQSEWQKVIADEADQVLSSGLQSDLTQNEIDTIYSGIAAHLPSAKKITHRLWLRVAAAAVIFIAVSAGLVLYLNDIKKHAISEFSYTADVAPGKASATLTLASGKKIRLIDAANGELANESGISISKTADGQLVYEIKGSDADPNKVNTLSTAKGETYQLRLPDGSLVYLNAASSLTYAASLIERGKRVVKLRGEGYFEISKDKAHPFIVTTGQQEVQVLGTHFNINAYPDEPAVATTLLEGSVKVSSGGNQQILKPGFQAINDGSAIKVVKANVENITDWKDGDFNLDGLDFRLAMRKIGRWYDVEVIYESGIPDGIETGGWISRNNKLSDVLKLIEKSGFVHFKVEGKKLYVFK